MKQKRKKERPRRSVPLDRSLFSDLDYLERLLDIVTAEQGGKELLGRIERLRKLCLELKKSFNPEKERSLLELIEKLDLASAVQIVSAFDLSFNLLNVAEENFAMQIRAVGRFRRGRPEEGSGKNDPLADGNDADPPGDYRPSDRGEAPDHPGEIQEDLPVDFQKGEPSLDASRAGAP
jgi:hypothetical protein